MQVMHEVMKLINPNMDEEKEKTIIEENVSNTIRSLAKDYGLIEFWLFWCWCIASFSVEI
ncbi:hypothetical protein BLOT_000618 [Blomia tropicalis]|nr:hypothetical protein BLOT_000618 [Blomia tropicalis]